MSWRGEYFRAARCTRESAIFGRERETANTRRLDSVKDGRVSAKVAERAFGRVHRGSLTRSLFTDEIMEHRYFRPVTQLPLGREGK